MLKFINLTPHPVVLSNGALQITFAKDYALNVARVEQLVEQRMVECEVAPGMKIAMPINVIVRSEVFNLPDPMPNVTYIVSSMVAVHVKRADVIAPMTDSTCDRDVKGRVISVKGFHTFTTVAVDEAVARLEVAVTQA